MSGTLWAKIWDVSGMLLLSSLMLTLSLFHLFSNNSQSHSHSLGTKSPAHFKNENVYEISGFQQKFPIKQLGVWLLLWLPSLPTITLERLGAAVFGCQVALTALLEIFGALKRPKPGPPNTTLDEEPLSSVGDNGSQTFRPTPRSKAQYHALALGLITFVVAAALNHMDQYGPLCWPDNHVFTVHGLWHLACSFAIYQGFRFYVGGEFPTK